MDDGHVTITLLISDSSLGQAEKVGDTRGLGSPPSGPGAA
jgi:hypothetical protein